MTTIEIFLGVMIVIFAVPFLVWRIFKTDLYAPLVVVQIIAGIILGPGLLGQVAPDFHQSIFKPEVMVSLTAIATWAAMLFVFIAGVELDLDLAWSNRRETIITATSALFAPLILGALAAFILLRISSGWTGPNTSTWQFVMGVGMACAVTALPILVLLLDKLEILRMPLGQRILRYASADDVAIWLVLAAILLDGSRMTRQLLFIAGFMVTSFVIRKILPKLQEPDRWYASLIWLAVSGFAADWAGLHFMVGAFLSGLLIDPKWLDQSKTDHFRNLVLLTLMPVFFLSTGLRTTWELGGTTVVAAAALLLFASIVGKLAGVHIAAKILDWPKGEATTIGWLLQTKALIMIIFANVLLDKGIIASATFTSLLLMAVASTMLTVPMVRKRLK